MIHIRDLTPTDIGRWVVYRDRPFAAPEDGRIKKVGKNVVWVVFHCDGDWDRFDQFNAAACDPRDLELKE